MDRRAPRALLVLFAALLALGGLTAASPAAPALAAGCVFGGRTTDSDTGRPIAGMRKTLVETGQTATTDRDGAWSLEAPGPGTFTVVSEHPDYVTTTYRYVLDGDCRVTSRTQVQNDGDSAPAAPPPPPSGQAHRVTGRLTLEGKAAPGRTRVFAYVGRATCGEATVGANGAFTLDVLSTVARPGCAQAGGTVQLGATPAFGIGWLLGSVTFEMGGTSQLDLAWDPRRHPGDAKNVPWLNIDWEQPDQIPIGLCEDMSEASADAVIAAVDEWRAAFRSRGLVSELVADGDAACGDEAPGIAVIEDTLSEPRAIAGAGHVYLDTDGKVKGCRARVACTTFKSVIIINPTAMARLGAEERANVIAHEIGHALGLDHARACTGGTIMWKDTACRFPMTVIGADDIASLNEKVTGGVLAKDGEPEPEALASEDGSGVLVAVRGSTGGVLSHLPPSESLLADGSVTMADVDRSAAFVKD